MCKQQSDVPCDQARAERGPPTSLLTPSHLPGMKLDKMELDRVELIFPFIKLRQVHNEN